MASYRLNVQHQVKQDDRSFQVIRHCDAPADTGFGAADSVSLLYLNSRVVAASLLGRHT